MAAQLFAVSVVYAHAPQTPVTQGSSPAQGTSGSVEPPKPAPTSTPLTQEIPTTTILKDITINGYLDFYYQIDFGHPSHDQTVSGRWYDINHDSYQLAGAELDVDRVPTTRHPFGFGLTILEGSNSSILAGTEPGGVKSYKDFSQAYVTYLVPIKPTTTVDFGKWYAFVGYEGLDSRVQDNYSRSFTFTSMEPDYMTGFRLTSSLTPNLNLNGYFYQGYNEVKNSNSTLMTGLGATYAVTEKLSATVQGYNGKESDDKLNNEGTYGGIGFPTAGPSWVTQGNLVIVYNPTGRDKIAFDGTYASAVDKGVWNGEAIYYRRQLASRQDCALRLERSDDTNGLRFYNGPMMLYSVTGTYDYAVGKNLLLRFELREDYANKPFFNCASGLSTQRTTFTFAQVVKF